MENRLLTVNVITFNQEKYISHCIDSLLSQKTDFDYIIRIFEDCSTDNTAAICKSYAEKYPDKIEFYPSSVNLGAERNALRSYQDIRTKYYMFIEGDDYCIDDNKFQKQVDILEQNPNLSFCAHEVVIDNINDSVMAQHKQLYSGVAGGLYTFDDYKNKYIWSPHISSKIVRTDCIDISEENWQYFVLDITQTLMLIQKGDAFFIEKPMTVWNCTGEGVWTNKNGTYRARIFCQKLLAYNEHSNYILERSILKVMADYIYYIFNNEKNKELEQPQCSPSVEVSQMKLRLKRFKHYILSPMLIDFLNLPRDISRKLRGKDKNNVTV